MSSSPRNKSDNSIGNLIDTGSKQSAEGSIVERVREQVAKNRCQRIQFAEYAAGRGEPQSYLEWRFYFGYLSAEGNREVFCRHIKRFIEIDFGEIDPEEGGFHFIAEYCIAMNLANEALVILNRVLELAPDHIPSLLEKINALEHLGEDEAVRILYQKLIETCNKGEDKANIIYCYGCYLWELKRTEEALNMFREMAEENPCAENYRDLAEHLNEAGFYEEATEAEKKALKLQKSEPEKMDKSNPLVQMADEVPDSELVRMVASMGVEPAREIIRKNKKRN